MNFTLITAIWGAVLATILAIIETCRFFRDKVRLKVTVEGGYHIIPPSPPFGDAELIRIFVANVGRRPVTLTKAGLLAPRGVEAGKYLACIASFRPLSLSEGKSHSYHIREDEARLVGIPSDKYVALVVDARGKSHWSHDVVTRFLKLHRTR